jgi:hypothetical protein
VESLKSVLPDDGPVRPKYVVSNIGIYIYICFNDILNILTNILMS